MGSDLLDFSQDRLYGRNPAALVREHERDSGQREGPTSAEQQRIKALEREVKELRKANEILKLASVLMKLRCRLFSHRRTRPPLQVVSLHQRAPRGPGVEPICRCCRSPCRLTGAMPPSSVTPLGVAPGHGVTRH